ncbi:DUF6130 family protein [Amycolatopsis sp. lyj-108]|uniref:DUF6130 family protein n=1 Tax=Amycolatopsis sp. lyj-108 TaxID=2789286 RepID=UPI003978F9AD
MPAFGKFTLLAVLLTAACGAPPPAPPAAAPPAAATADWSPAPVVPRPSQPPPSLVVDAPLPEQLAMGLVVLRYRAENLRIVPVYGPAALDVSPRIGHIHVTVDDAAWHWADGSGEPLIIQSLPAGPHKVWIGLADPTHKILDQKTLTFVVPVHSGHH